MQQSDIGVSPAEMLYGTTIRLPGEFFETFSHPDSDPSSFVSLLREKIQLLRPIPIVTTLLAKFLFLKHSTHVHTFSSEEMLFGNLYNLPTTALLKL